MGVYTTTAEINTGGLLDYEIEIRVEYVCRPGSPATMEHPGDDPETEITAIGVKNGDKWEDCDWLHTLLCDDEELIGECGDDHDAMDEMAADDAADARRERLREDRA